MKTRSLRTRVAIITLALLTVILAAVIAAVTLAYRAKLDSDLRSRLGAAGAAVARAGSADAAKPLMQGLALEGIATRLGSATQPLPAGKGAIAVAPTKTGATIQTRGSLLVLDEVLPDGSEASFSISRASVNHAVTSLLEIEFLVALTALALAAALIFRTTRIALRPLAQVIDTATRIAGGESTLRLRPSRNDTELGSLATAFDHMVNALEAAIAEARASDAATRQFLADASHELRTPIASLQASVETLLREQPERPSRDQLEATLAREAARLGRLVDDLLGLARLEAQPQRDPVELDALARTALHDLQARAPHAHLTLTHDNDTTVIGDRDALDRALRNLLDNAHSAIPPAGEIRIELRRKNGYVETKITDDGPGVPDTERERIFERFVRLNNPTLGSGLGLAIARRIARQHNGDLTCDPANSGATFTLRLPAAMRTAP